MNDQRPARSSASTDTSTVGSAATGTTPSAGRHATPPSAGPVAPDHGSAARLLGDRVRLTPDRPILAQRHGDTWTTFTAAETLARVRGIAKGFVAAGLEPGAHVAILSRTRLEWTLVDFAVWTAGLVSVPVYETSSPDQVRWILSDSESVAIVVEQEEHARRVASIAPDLPSLGQHWTIDGGGLDDLTRLGEDVTDDELDARTANVHGHDDATIIYTSGSTGRPKGCVLRHDNFTATVEGASEAMPEVVADGASTLLFIPLAHVFARFIAAMSVSAGVLVGHEPDTKDLMRAVSTFKPTFLLAVPRVFEKIYNSAEQKADLGGKGRIFRAAADTAVAHSEALAAGRVPFLLGLKFKLFDRLVYAKLRDALGGRVEYAVSGSAPLSPRLSHFFRSIGVLILEGYGLTETTAPATVNRARELRIGTVGRALPGIEVRIADDGEILIRGVDVFDRYWRNDEATEHAFADGWFRTGDLGRIDADGVLTVTGRAKELIVTASGKNVAPAPLEDGIREHPLIGQVVVVGEGKPFVAALVTLDREMLPGWCESRGITPALSGHEAAYDERVLSAVQEAIDAANGRVSRAESVRSFTILDTDLTEASGHLTPKLTIKRSVILKDFAADIDHIYSGSKVQTTATPVIEGRRRNRA
ncbi:AMP-dependent synthetase/ligase [Curtobacterium flaccumfaciens]|uniref:AMP-dependent synthetase/ligase n=1 Tax=Curtobacterium flaccumfaciens TaxID=2035 RepID=UPI000FFEEB87|nr:long-chain fatty acid--CoA ligase [Curtobacterium flaccumfaciens]MCS0646599.1 long-chain fatty acid--CoA ligase [Curtobacterium flaccumfaciens pv. flaccumfaciens]MCS6526026.1 long-chain fatty acid--CoA ligase [Curtobacterium flaccumfaciens pv. flaccumfaciens]MCS6528619.1 long-chain fatty acid--CoA ligase [Curtobacterium flaccumfaciens pv. flaccumfaciens]NUU11470.1 long-chain fatty acid--CoA ligase [Curtobacterium flaccumfaciens]RXF85361.1 long-chain fatty acid--CoA ligase [Curtobacterium fl